jgi:hypothetical protein
MSCAGAVFLFNVAERAGVAFYELEPRIHTAAGAQTSGLTPDKCKQLLDQSKKENDLLKKQKLKNDWKTCVNKNCPKTPKATAAKGGLECSKNAACQAFCEENRTDGKIDCCKNGPQEKPACLNRVEGVCVPSTPEKKEDLSKKESSPELSEKKDPAVEVLKELEKELAEKKMIDEKTKAWIDCKFAGTCPYGDKTDIDAAFTRIANEEKWNTERAPRSYKNLEEQLFIQTDVIRQARNLPELELSQDTIKGLNEMARKTLQFDNSSGPTPSPESPKLFAGESGGTLEQRWRDVPLSENVEDRRYERSAFTNWIMNTFSAIDSWFWQWVPEK